MLTDEEKSKIHSVMESCGGDRNMAAAALGMTPQKLKDTLHNSPELKSRWTRSKAATQPPSAVSVLERPALIADRSLVPAEPIQTPDEVEAELTKTEAKLKGGIAKLALTMSEKELAESAHSFHLRHNGQTIDIIGGCAALMAIKLTDKTRGLLERLAEVQGDVAIATPEEKEGALMEMEKLLQAIPAFSSEIRKLADMVEKNGIAKAELAIKANGEPRKRGKPGFAPLVAIKAEPGARVEIRDNGRQD